MNWQLMVKQTLNASAAVKFSVTQQPLTLNCEYFTNKSETNPKKTHHLWFETTHAVCGENNKTRGFLTKRLLPTTARLLLPQQLNREKNLNGYLPWCWCCNHWFQRLCPTVVALKHMNPWYRDVDDIETAWDYALTVTQFHLVKKAAESWSDAQTAKKMHAIFPWNHHCT